MSARDHTEYREEIGAYLLGALTDLERQAFERHVAGCAECRDELERLRPAADALPRSVEQVEPPPGLKTSLMDVVESEDAITIRGYSCPLAAIVGDHPEACTVAEQLVSGVVGAKVIECCDRSGPPRCSFRVLRSADSARA